MFLVEFTQELRAKALKGHYGEKVTWQTM